MPAESIESNGLVHVNSDLQKDKGLDLPCFKHSKNAHFHHLQRCMLQGEVSVLP